MSWSIYAQAAKASEVREKLEAAAQSALDFQPFDSWDDDVAEQQVVAFEAAETLAAALDEAGESGPFSINANGHARRTDADLVMIGVNVSAPPKPKPAAKK